MSLQSRVDSRVLSDHGIDGLGSAEHLNSNRHPFEPVDLGFEPRGRITLCRIRFDRGSAQPFTSLLDHSWRGNLALQHVGC